MEMTQFVRKKLQLLFPSDKERAEVLFVKQFVVNNEPCFDPILGIQQINFIEFCRRCHKHRIAVIGFDIYIIGNRYYDSFSWENINSQYSWSWSLEVMVKIEPIHHELRIFPVVDIEISVLEDYLSS